MKFFVIFNLVVLVACVQAQCPHPNFMAKHLTLGDPVAKSVARNGIDGETTNRVLIGGVLEDSVSFIFAVIAAQYSTSIFTSW